MMELLVNPTFTALVAVVIGAVGGYLGKRRDSAASIQEVWTKSTAALIGQYTDALNASRLETAALKREIAELSAKVDAQSGRIESQTEEIDALNEHIDTLTSALNEHGIKPPPRRRKVTVAPEVTA